MKKFLKQLVRWMRRENKCVMCLKTHRRLQGGWGYRGPWLSVSTTCSEECAHELHQLLWEEAHEVPQDDWKPVEPVGSYEHLDERCDFCESDHRAVRWLYQDDVPVLGKCQECDEGSSR